jgi:hypothetical protein
VKLLAVLALLFLALLLFAALTNPPVGSGEGLTGAQPAHHPDDFGTRR